MRVLIVEDDEDFRLSLVDLLGKIGYTVDSAESAPQAMQMLNAADVLLTDISLTGMDGLELCDLAHNWYPDLDVVIMTGYDSPGNRAGAALCGAKAYLTKPFEKNELLEGLGWVLTTPAREDSSPKGRKGEEEPDAEAPRAARAARMKQGGTRAAAQRPSA